MTDARKTKMIYSVARFVPSVARGEFVNVGVVVAGKRLVYRAVKNTARAERLAAEQPDPVSPATVRHLISSLPMAVGEDAFACDSKVAPEDALYECHRNRHGIIQFSQPLPALAASENEALDLLWKVFVLE